MPGRDRAVKYEDYIEKAVEEMSRRQRLGSGLPTRATLPMRPKPLNPEDLLADVDSDTPDADAPRKATVCSQPGCNTEFIIPFNIKGNVRMPCPRCQRKLKRRREREEQQRQLQEKQENN